MLKKLGPVLSAPSLSLFYFLVIVQVFIGFNVSNEHSTHFYNVKVRIIRSLKSIDKSMRSADAL